MKSLRSYSIIKKSLRIVLIVKRDRDKFNRRRHHANLPPTRHANQVSRVQLPVDPITGMIINVQVRNNNIFSYFNFDIYKKGQM